MTTCGMINPLLRDPLTIAISFMANPAPFRGCSLFTLEVWDRAVYLEGPLCCALGRRLIVTDEHGARCGGGRGGRGGASPSERKRINSQSMPLTLETVLRYPQGGIELWGMDRIAFLTFKNVPNVTSLGETFMRGSTSLIHAVFEDLPALTEVGYWLDGCEALESATFCRLPKLTSVGDNWLRWCNALTEVVIEDLPELTTVGDQWMFECEALESVVISDLPKLETVAPGLLVHCVALKEAVFRDLPKLRVIGEGSSWQSGWMTMCPVLESVILSNLPELVKIEQAAMADCSQLIRVVLEGLPNLSEIGVGFLSNSWNDSLGAGGLSVDVASCHENVVRRNDSWTTPLDRVVVLVRGCEVIKYAF